MIATVILSVLIFGAFFYIVYTRFIKRSKGHCDSCHDQEHIQPFVDSEVCSYSW